MSYTWVNGELITAEKLNNTGGGGGVFVINASTGNDDSPVLDKTVDEIIDAIQDGLIPIIVYEQEYFYCVKTTIDMPFLGFERQQTSYDYEGSITGLEAAILDVYKENGETKVELNYASIDFDEQA